MFLTASYDDQKNLTQRDRNFSAHSYNLPIGLDTSSGNTFPGFVSTGGIGSFVEYPACPNPNFESDRHAAASIRRSTRACSRYRTPSS